METGFSLKMRIKITIRQVQITFVLSIGNKKCLDFSHSMLSGEIITQEGYSEQSSQALPEMECLSIHFLLHPRSMNLDFMSFYLQINSFLSYLHVPP